VLHDLPPLRRLRLVLREARERRWRLGAHAGRVPVRGGGAGARAAIEGGRTEVEGVLGGTGAEVMSENTNIEWCTHTFNAWWGCTKVHTGCANCYAEATDARWGGDHWGKDASRRMILGEWGKPAKWNEAAEAAGTPATVFASSMCDVFEAFDGAVVNQQDQRLYIERPGRLINAEIARNLITTTDTGDPVTLAYLRSKLWPIIESTPWLRWLLLTKRPENITGMVPGSWLEAWPAHVWTGTSPVNQETADECIPRLLKVPGKHFLSVEPMVGLVNLTPYMTEIVSSTDTEIEERRLIDWVICGGESGTGKTIRPFDLLWARSLRDQCAAAGVPFFMKQLGAKPCNLPLHIGDGSGRGGLLNKKGGDPAEWPEDLRVRELPEWRVDQ